MLAHCPELSVAEKTESRFVYHFVIIEKYVLVKLNRLIFKIYKILYSITNDPDVVGLSMD